MRAGSRICGSYARDVCSSEFHSSDVLEQMHGYLVVGGELLCQLECAQVANLIVADKVHATCDLVHFAHCLDGYVAILIESKVSWQSSVEPKPLKIMPKSQAF